MSAKTYFCGHAEKHTGARRVWVVLWRQAVHDKRISGQDRKVQLYTYAAGDGHHDGGYQKTYSCVEAMSSNWQR